jgi:hypothetical protein
MASCEMNKTYKLKLNAAEASALHAVLGHIGSLQDTPLLGIWNALHDAGVYTRYVSPYESTPNFVPHYEWYGSITSSCVG